MIAIRDSLSDSASSDNAEHGEDDKDDDNTMLSKLSEDDKQGRVMGTISKPVWQHIERFRKKQMKLDEFTQPGWCYSAGNFSEEDMIKVADELKVPAVSMPWMDDITAAPTVSIFGEPMQTLEIVPGIWQML